MIEEFLENLLTQQHITYLAMAIPLWLQLGGMVCAVLLDSYISKKHKRMLISVAILVLLLIAQNFLENDVAAGEPQWSLRIVTAIVGYSIRPIVLVIFIYIVSPDKNHVWAWILCGVNAAVHLTALFSDICFYIDETNHYHGGPLSNFCFYVSLVFLVCLIFLTIREYGHRRKSEMVFPLAIVLLIFAAILLDGNVGKKQQPVTFLTGAIVSSCVFFYIWLHLQFVREHEQDLKARQRIQIMMTQIQPHFLYNTIATIKALCKRKPDKAAEVADKFGRYLRQNMETLDAPDLIPFKTELEHTQIYADIEMIRFDNIRVEYDIQENQFQVPPLTLQPIVENAIRHGVRIREKGRIRVTAKRCEGMYEVIIEDNGIGFDTQSLKEIKGQHIGISNVRERIEKMCGGTLCIDSKRGEGTRAVISIPVYEERRI